MIDKNKKWVYKFFDIIDVVTQYGEFQFTSVNYMQDSQQTYIQKNKWKLMKLFNNRKKKKKYLDFKQNFETILQNKINFLIDTQFNNIEYQQNKKLK